MAVQELKASDATDWLWEPFCQGDLVARDLLLAKHYDAFRKAARSVLAGEGPKINIQPTELANEAAIRLLKLSRLQIRDRSHYLALASRIMRQILLDEVRRFKASKRKVPIVETCWAELAGNQNRRGFDLEAFDRALDRLSTVDGNMAAIVEQRFYAGLTMEEIAEANGVSESTVKRQWRIARAWLLDQLQEA